MSFLLIISLTEKWCCAEIKPVSESINSIIISIRAFSIPALTLSSESTLMPYIIWFGANANTDSHANAETYADANVDANTDSNADNNADANVDANTDSYALTLTLSLTLTLTLYADGNALFVTHL